MTISLRLDDRTEALLRRLTRQHKRSRSAVIRDAIASLAKARPVPEGKDAYAKMAPGLGKWDSGGAQLSTQSGKKFRKLLLQKKIRARRSG